LNISKINQDASREIMTIGIGTAIDTASIYVTDLHGSLSRTFAIEHIISPYTLTTGESARATALMFTGGMNNDSLLMGLQTASGHQGYIALQ
jgi:hypothetical protein